MPTQTLIVDDDPASMRLTEKYLSLSGYEVLKATNVQEAMRIVLDQAPPIVITDYSMPGANGSEFCRMLRRHEGVRFVYIVMITASNDIAHLVEAFDCGADDFVAKPINPQILLARLRAGERVARLEADVDRRSREIHLLNAEMAKANDTLARMNEQLKKMAVTDELTGLLNRREASVRLRELWAAEDRYGSQVACIMIDIDHFKRVNDNYGHDAGDGVLHDLGQILRRNIRPCDPVFRIGGEEFLVLCPHTDLDGAAACAGKLREVVEKNGFRHKGRSLPLTISLGVAVREADMEAPEDLMKLADEALYASKRAGRNRVTRAKIKTLLPSER